MDINYYMYDGGYSYFKDEINAKKLIDINLSYTKFNGAYCIPFVAEKTGAIGGGVIDSNLDYIEGTTLHRDDRNFKYKRFDPADIEVVHEPAIYLGLFHSCWGNVITDNIKRFWFLLSDEYNNMFKNCKLVYIPTESYSKNKFSQINELLEVFGLDDNLLPIEKITKFDELMIPDESFWNSSGDRLYTKEYKKTIDYIIDNIDEPDDRTVYDKIFLSYTNNVIGSEELENFFLSHNYTSVSPGKLSLKRQIWLYQHCSTIAGLLGSSTHNIVFAKDDTKLEIIPRSYYLTGYQVALNSLRNYNVAIIDSTLSNGVMSDSPWHGFYYVYISNKLKNYFNDSSKYSKKEIKRLLYNYIKYISFCKIRYINFSTTPPSYYQKEVENVVEGWKKEIHISKIKYRIISLYYLIKSTIILSPKIFKKLINYL